MLVVTQTKVVEKKRKLKKFSLEHKKPKMMNIKVLIQMKMTLKENALMI